MIRRGSQVRVLSDPPFSNKFKLIVGLFFWDFLFFDICILGRTICNFIDRALGRTLAGFNLAKSLVKTASRPILPLLAF